MNQTPVLCILSSAASKTSDHALGKFAEFLGLPTEVVEIPAEANLAPRLDKPSPGGRVLALGRTTLQSLIRQDWFAQVLNETSFLFVYGFAAVDGELPELKWLTGGALSSVTLMGAGPRKFLIHADVKFGSFPVSGGSYSTESTEVAAFDGRLPTEDFETYISVDGRPHFVRGARGRASVFLLAGQALVDIDTALTPEDSLRPWYSQLIAMAMFLRAVGGTQCWTAPSMGATFIVDDPYLKRRYGFIHYETLLGELHKVGGALTVAFIPYNYRRSDPKTVEILRSHSERFSIAVHGCDHTGGEFASLDQDWLAGTADCALELMEAHTGRTQMPFDRVMVFPQGRFSTRAVRALKATGYAAAVNTTAWPEDFGENPLTLRDLLGVAVMRYEQFPIFLRRYPRDVFDYAFDALFQKPVLAVEHHGFFRHGYGPLSDVFDDLEKMPGKLVWGPLGKTVASSCVYRRTGEGECTLRHFSPVLCFRNPTSTNLAVSVEKPEQDGVVESVSIGKHEVPFEVRSGFLRYVVQLRVGEEINAVVRYRRTLRGSRKPSLKYRIAATARRRLSDVRDNYLARSERVLAVAEGIKNAMARGKGRA
jgi:hypothetical protein